MSHNVYWCYTRTQWSQFCSDKYFRERDFKIIFFLRIQNVEVGSSPGKGVCVFRKWPWEEEADGFQRQEVALGGGSRWVLETGGGFLFTL